MLQRRKKMNKEQESLIASGLWLLIKNSNEIENNEKLTWMNDFDKLFGEKELKNEPCCEMPEEEDNAFVSKEVKQNE